MQSLPTPAAPPVADVDDLGCDLALLQLGRRLQAAGYRFTTITPLSHQRNNARPENHRARSARDVFGWSRPFARELLAPADFDALATGGVLREHAGLWASDIRWSSLADLLLVHSAFPTVAHDAVFLGPDTYRFAQAIEAHLQACTQPIERAVDIGCGSGAGALLIGRARGEAQVLAVDINPAALRFTAVNAALAGVANVTAWHSDILAGTEGDFDLIVANPPYMQDTQGRAYRDGGEGMGSALSVRIVEQALARLRVGGTLLLYTGAPCVDGQDLFFQQVQPQLAAPGLVWVYRELDPDVFGEELETPGYRTAERIAAVLLTVTRMPETLPDKAAFPAP
ncbi:methyltransferase [Pseudomonas sp. TE3610]